MVIVVPATSCQSTDTNSWSDLFFMLSSDTRSALNSLDLVSTRCEQVSARLHADNRNNR